MSDLQVDEETRTLLFDKITELLGEHLDNSVDEMRILSMVVSYVLCNHVPGEVEAYSLLSNCVSAVDKTMKAANKSGHTIWVEGRGH